jgi:hypothetical protein
LAGHRRRETKPAASPPHIVAHRNNHQPLSVLADIVMPRLQHPLVRGVACLANVGEELHHQLALVEPSEIGHLLEDTQHGRLVVVQVLELLEHERTSAVVAASFTAGDGVRLTGRAAVVDVAPRKYKKKQIVSLCVLWDTKAAGSNLDLGCGLAALSPLLPQWPPNHFTAFLLKYSFSCSHG